MATHNTVQLAGYLLEDPAVANPGVTGAEKIFLKLRTIRREAENVEAHLYEDVFVFYDGTELITRMKNLKKFDMIEVKGVFNIVSVNKKSRCPDCGHENEKMNGTYSFVYPIWFRKIDNFINSFEYNANLPESILFQHFQEVSNYMTIVGTLVMKPEMVGTDDKPVCRYRLGVDRKYYITTQPDVKADYPWVYTRGQQALDDFRHLDYQSVVLVDGYIHTRYVSVPATCEECKSSYRYPDVVTDFIPYSVEYLRNYKTDEDIAREERMLQMPG